MLRTRHLLLMYLGRSEAFDHFPGESSRAGHLRRIVPSTLPCLLISLQALVTADPPFLGLGGRAIQLPDLAQFLN